MTDIPYRVVDEWVAIAWKAVQTLLYIDPDYTTVYEETKVAVEKVAPLVADYVKNQIADALANAPLRQVEYRQRVGEQANGVYGDAILHAADFIRGWSP
jgi:hypothetical protein